MADLRFQHATTIYVLEAFDSEQDDLVAVGGEHSVQVIYVTATTCKSIATFHVGCRITALAWSNSTVSPSSSDNWCIELTAAGSEFGLFQLTKSASDSETIFQYGGGLSGHHGKVNSIVYCGGRGEDSVRYVATVSDDKMLMIWDLQPTLDIPSLASSPRAHSSSSPHPNANGENRLQPTAYVIPFPHALTSVASHPSSSKEFLVSDDRGSVFLTDWRSFPSASPPSLSIESQEEWRHSSVVELIDPAALAAGVMGLGGLGGASVAWRKDPAVSANGVSSSGNSGVVGATIGGRFHIWDLGHVRGGLPVASGTGGAGAGSRFRWSPTHPEYFAISSATTIQMHNTHFPTAQPTVFNLGPGGRVTVRDFDFLKAGTVPRIAAAVGREVVVFWVGDEV